MAAGKEDVQFGLERGSQNGEAGVRIVYLASIALAPATQLLCPALAESCTGACRGLVVLSLTRIFCAGA